MSRAISSILLSGLTKITSRKLFLSEKDSRNNFEVRSNYLTSVCFDLVLMSNIEISYSEIQENDIINSVVGISNFDVGLLENMNYSLDIKVNNQNFTLERKENYDDIIKQLRASLSTHVTSFIKFRCIYKNLQQMNESLHNLYQLISFGNANWIVPVYMDIIKNDKVMKSIFYQVKKYPFIRSRYLIKNHSQNNNFKYFLEKSYSKYLELLSRYKKMSGLIEFYLSALSSLVADVKDSRILIRKE